MAGLAAILNALARSVWRDVRSFQSVSGNNFVLFVILVSYQQPESIYFFALILALLLLGPLSADPMRKIPPDRLAAWPLSFGQRMTLRLTTPALTPILWMAIVFFVAGKQAGVALILVALGLAMQLATGLWSHLRAGRPPLSAFRLVPRFPGRLGGLVQKDLRQILSVLDPYIALALTASCLAYRFLSRNPDPEALLILTLVVTIALSTYAQSLFGLDLPSGVVRYRIFPLRGYEILFAKDIAFLIVLLVVVLPLNPLPGIAAGLIALAAGHHASVLQPRQQTRWRFTAGILIPIGLLQVIPMTAIGVAVARSSIWYLALAVAAYLASLAYYGREKIWSL
ncbi:MAG TPA: hypothetical protein VGV35_14415 [Bryobacteraceae bacterium]|nr:hypothetical protein [Bryobacteraceae bacterium]